MFVCADYRSTGELQENWWKKQRKNKREELRLFP